MHTLVFIDSRVLDVDTLIAGLGADVEVFFLGLGEDGVEQMRTDLAGRAGVDSIQIVSHGSEGVIYMGSTVLASGNLAAHADALAAIGQSLTDTGDILLYGCNVAVGADGQQFIEMLARLTGAEVAASADLTGNAELGGYCVLEARTGSIEADGINATEYAEMLEVWVDWVPADPGTAAADNFVGQSLNNRFTGNGGNDTMHGRPSADRSVYPGVMRGYVFGVDSSNHVSVTDVNAGNGNEGVDTLIDIERASFGDGNVNILVNGETRINLTTIGDQFSPAVAMLADGSYEVTWAANGIVAQHCNPQGAGVGEGIGNYEGAIATGSSPAVSAFSGGGCVLAWRSGNNIGAQYCGDGGAPLASEILVNATPTEWQIQEGLADFDGNGGIDLLWWNPATHVLLSTS